MAITFEKLQELLRKQNFHFLIASDQPLLRAGVAGIFGHYEFVILLQDEGQFLQFRTVSYLRCPSDSPHLLAALRAIAHVNYLRRTTKFGWDPTDGEIVGYSDALLMDNDLTQEQLARIMGNYLPIIDVAYPRIQQAIETGNDPGELDPQELAKRLEEAKKQGPPGPGGGTPPGAAPEPPGSSPEGPSRPSPAEPSIREI